MKQLLRAAGALSALLLAGPAQAIVAPAAAPTAAKVKNRREPAPLPGVVYHGARDAKRIALTFDACSLRKGDRVDQPVLDTLLKLNVPATLFLGGKWMEDDAETVAALAKNPSFELASHSYMHPHLTRMGSKQIEEEVTRSQANFERLVGRRATLIRAPYGELDGRVVKTLLKSGLTPVQYDLASGDPDPKFNKARLTRGVLKNARPGSIVVLHMNGNGKHTGEALPDIVEGLRKQGYELVTVSQLLAPPAPAAPAGEPSIAGVPLAAPEAISAVPAKATAPIPGVSQPKVQ